MSTKPRVKLNREFIKLKKGQTIKCRILALGTKSWEEVDEATGEFVPRSAVTLECQDHQGRPFRMFQDGGLKAALDGIALNTPIEIEFEGKEDIANDPKTGEPRVCNKYGVYAAEF